MLKDWVAHNATEGTTETAYHKEKPGRFVKHKILALKKLYYFQRVESLLHVSETETNPSLPAGPLDMDKEKPLLAPQESPIPFLTETDAADSKRISKIFQCRQESRDDKGHFFPSDRTRLSGLTPCFHEN